MLLLLLLVVVLVAVVGDVVGVVLVGCCCLLCGCLRCAHFFIVLSFLLVVDFGRRLSVVIC